jgi:hypothetical protein
MSLSEDWRQRHSPRQSNSRVILFIILLLMILLMTTRSGTISRKFTAIFFTTSDSAAVHPSDSLPE